MSVTCTETDLRVRYQPEVNFQGKMYMLGYSEDLECYTAGNGFEPILLVLPLAKRSCGVSEAFSPEFHNR